MYKGSLITRSSAGSDESKSTPSSSRKQKESEGKDDPVFPLLSRSAVEVIEIDDSNSDTDTIESPSNPGKMQILFDFEGLFKSNNFYFISLVPEEGECSTTDDSLSSVEIVEIKERTRRNDY